MSPSHPCPSPETCIVTAIIRLLLRAGHGFESHHLFGGVSSVVRARSTSQRYCNPLPPFPTFQIVSMAEWSNALDLRSSSFGSAGSNPARDTTGPVV